MPRYFEWILLFFRFLLNNTYCVGKSLICSKADFVKQDINRPKLPQWFIFSMFPCKISTNNFKDTPLIREFDWNSSHKLILDQRIQKW